MERDFLGVIDRAGKGGEAVEEDSRTEPDNPAAAQWQFPVKSGAAPAFMSFRTAREESSEEFSISGFRPAGNPLDGVRKQTSMPVISQHQQQRQFGLSSSQVPAQQYPAAAHGHRSQLQQGMMDYSAAALHLPAGGSRLVQPVSVRHPVPAVPFNQANLMARSQSFNNGTGGPSAKNHQQPFTMSNGFGGSTVGVYGTSRNPRTQTSAQLTIFYNGSVNVFDNVPVDKAKELMMLASRASIPSPPTASHRKPDSPISVPTKVNVPEVFPARQIVIQKPESCVPHLSSTSKQIVIQKPESCVPHLSSTSSPIPIVPQVVTLSRSTSNCPTEACSPKTVVQPPVAAPISQATSSQPLLATPSATAVTPRAVPQARKASLARFLEKRKERVTSVEPYPASKSSLGSSDTVGSASAPTKSSSTVIAPASNNCSEPVRLGQPRNISFSSEVCPSTKLHI